MRHLVLLAISFTLGCSRPPIVVAALEGRARLRSAASQEEALKILGDVFAGVEMEEPLGSELGAAILTVGTVHYERAEFVRFMLDHERSGPLWFYYGKRGMLRGRTVAGWLYMMSVRASQGKEVVVLEEKAMSDWPNPVRDYFEAVRVGVVAEPPLVEMLNGAGDCSRSNAMQDGQKCRDESGKE